ncbi:metalloregulator ArsR/SmtB family transcription factor [Naasia aerilata]|uniref:ArsR family transcriptional regulator n=1 Tax=Naasia aerilata TaxID=1162966 RepID=A0ABM8G8R9_9MICO|nr:metalloregulator ArsR/SmtB family transcription factor [Naasia aerilata]BDZ44575.1 ArsR family transcriptional regulator [Naasia aerilata]
MAPGGMLSTLAEPTRLRIVELLAGGPRTVGEVALALDALQPQTSKHVQALEAAGLVTVHRLGRRKVVSLRREALQELGEWFSALARRTASDDALERYAAGVAAEETRARIGAGLARRITLRRSLPASRSDVWRAWTTPDLLARWWAPPHFEVLVAELEPAPGGVARLVLQEPDGAVHRAEGECVKVDRERRLEFTLAPLAPGGSPLFVPLFQLVLTDAEPAPGGEDRGRGGTDLELTIEVPDAAPGSASALAGLEPGWTALLDQLSGLLTSGPSDDSSGPTDPVAR